MRLLEWTLKYRPIENPDKPGCYIFFLEEFDGKKIDFNFVLKWSKDYPTKTFNIFTISNPRKQLELSYGFTYFDIFGNKTNEKIVGFILTKNETLNKIPVVGLKITQSNYVELVDKWQKLYPYSKFSKTK